MEDTLRVPEIIININNRSLNPCFNGRYSQSMEKLKMRYDYKRLNPCFNGRYSQSEQFFSYRLHLQS